MWFLRIRVEEASSCKNCFAVENFVCCHYGQVVHPNNFWAHLTHFYFFSRLCEVFDDRRQPTACSSRDAARARFTARLWGVNQPPRPPRLSALNRPCSPGPSPRGSRLDIVSNSCSLSEYFLVAVSRCLSNLLIHTSLLSPCDPSSTLLGLHQFPRRASLPSGVW